MESWKTDGEWLEIKGIKEKNKEIMDGRKRVICKGLFEEGEEEGINQGNISRWGGHFYLHKEILPIKTVGEGGHWPLPIVQSHLRLFLPNR
jgi:hypothetical protein